MRRALLSLVAGLVVAVATGLGTGEYLVAVVCGVAASLLTGLVSFSTFVKNILDGTKTFYEILAKKREWERQESRIVIPSEQDIKNYGTPYKTVERDLLASYRKERQVLPEKDFISSSEEVRIKDVGGP